MICYSEILLHQIILTSFIIWHNMSMQQNLILSFLLSSKWNHYQEILIWLNKCTQFWGQFNKWKVIVTSMRYLDFKLLVIWCNLLHFVPEKCVFNIYRILLTFMNCNKSWGAALQPQRLCCLETIYCQ